MFANPAFSSSSWAIGLGLAHHLRDLGTAGEMERVTVLPLPTSVPAPGFWPTTVFGLAAESGRSPQGP